MGKRRKMAYKYQFNPGIQDNISLRSARSTIQRNRHENGTLRRYNSTSRHRHQQSGDPDHMSCPAKCCFSLFILIAQILLNGVMGLCLYWVIRFHSDQNGVPFAWKEPDRTDLQFNLHPVLMMAGFIYFMGQAMLIYRTCRCCRRIWNKLLHTIFHILAIPCVTIGFIAVWDSHALPKNPIPHFYSLHSWMGLATMGLFALQFVVGFFSFLLLLCCESATASFRASLVPIHSAFGIVTFMLAVATACAGLLEKAFFSLSTRLVDDESGEIIIIGIGDEYQQLTEEGITLNVLGALLVGLGVLIPWIIGCTPFRKGLKREGIKSANDQI